MFDTQSWFSNSLNSRLQTNAGIWSLDLDSMNKCNVRIKVRKWLLCSRIKQEWNPSHTIIFLCDFLIIQIHQYLDFIGFSMLNTFLAVDQFKVPWIIFHYFLYNILCFTVNPQCLCFNVILTVYHVLTPPPTEVFYCKYLCTTLVNFMYFMID